MRLAALAAFLLTIMSGVAFADGIPTEWQVGFQEAASPSMERIVDFHNLLLWLITAISLFVLALLVIVVVRFNEKANPTPSKTTHNTMIEVIWTAVPVIILVWLFIPSYNLMVTN
ncbi:MAG: cytochrome c oxidase subunit II, partial [Alphaproteobacteria bacterium]|nr:cytochrome c oxidase subunit II [Alphaproteobacteria bacterium]